MTDLAPTGELDVRFSAPDAVATPWATTWRVISDAELFWISTVRDNSPPHVTPLPAVWNQGALYFCTGGGEQKAVNLARNPCCTLTTGTNRWKDGIDVVIEGKAVRVRDETRLRQLADAWAEKYGADWQFDVDNHAFQGEGGEALVFEVVAGKILAFAKGDFAQTRYRL